jgi:DNA-binding CsgD family transcriptional regulator
MPTKPITKSRRSPRSAKRGASKPAGNARPAPSKARPQRVTRAVQLEALLRRSEGVTAAEVAKTMRIQEHTARALISINRRKLGWTVVLQERHYRIHP